MRRLIVPIAMMLWSPLAAQDASDIAARQMEGERARRELDRAVADAQASAAADRVRASREEAERLAAEARRQQALAAEYHRRRGESEAQSQAARAEADLARRAAERRVWAAEEAARRAEVQRQRIGSVPEAREIVAPPSGGSRRQAEPQRRADPQQAASRLVDMKEGVALCQRTRADEWRCTGPRRVAYGDVKASRRAVIEACGAASVRDLGMVRGLWAFGCGFGINPLSGAPGNRDVPALFGVDVPRRATFSCRATAPADCRAP